MPGGSLWWFWGMHGFILVFLGARFGFLWLILGPGGFILGSLGILLGHPSFHLGSILIFRCTCATNWWVQGAARAAQPMPGLE